MTTNNIFNGFDKEGDFLRTVLNSATEYAIIIADNNKMIHTWNEGAKRIFGYAPEEIIGKKTLSILFSEKERKSTNEIKEIQKSINDGIWQGEGFRQKKNGDTFIASLVVTPMKDKTEQIIGTIAIIQDITKKKHMEEKIKNYTKELEKEVQERTKEIQLYNSRIIRDLSSARRIQNSLLPKSLPSIPHYNFSVKYIASEMVSGDLYDIEMIDDDHLSLYVADVAGHGVAAAMLTVFLKQTIRKKFIKYGEIKLIMPNKVLYKLNKLLIEAEFSGSPQVTMFYGIINIRTNQITYSVAGHPPAILIRGNNHLLLGYPSKPLGWFSDVKYHNNTIKLNPDDRLFVYSDGMFELLDSIDIEDGERKFINILKQTLSQDINNQIEFILNQNSETPSDDIAFFGIEYKK